MKKVINMIMTSAKAAEIGAASNLSLAMRPVELDLDTMTPAAAWIAQHITSTFIKDEARDVIGISAVAGFTMQERDRKAGKSEDHIAAFASAYGDKYSKEPITIEEITFPYYGKSHKRPEDVIEEAAAELIKNGAVLLKAKNGEEFALN